MTFRCKDYSVTQILVGLYRVGVVGLQDSLKRAAASGLTDREQVVDLLVQELAAKNYVPDRQVEAFRIALWREYLRHRGLDFRAFFSKVEITVRGAPGEARDRFVELVRTALAEHELEPVVTFEDEAGGDPGPQLVVRGEVVARGELSPRSVRLAVRKSLSDW